MLKPKITILEKESGEWSQTEINAIVHNNDVKVEALRARSQRIALLNEPLRGSIQTTLGHSNYTSKIVDYYDRWK